MKQQPVILPVSYLAEKVGVSPATIRVYMCRSEFAHIRREYIKGVESYFYVSIYDIELLKKFVKRKPASKGKQILKKWYIKVDKEETKKLLDLVSQGYTISQIASFMSFSYNAIKARFGYLRQVYNAKSLKELKNLYKSGKITV